MNNIIKSVPKNRNAKKCMIEGKEFKSLNAAAIKLGMKLTSSEVERRCKSPKVKYKNWKIANEVKYPKLKISIDGYLFESPVHASKYISGMSPTDIRNRIYSNNALYRHWKTLDIPIVNISYKENEITLATASKIRESIPVIRCEGIDFYSQKDAAVHFNISVERVRQKLKSSRYSDWGYLK